MKVRYRAQALADIDEIRRYLETRSLSGARNVLRSIVAAIRFIAENPRGSKQTDDPDVHVKVIVEYPSKIFYSIRSDEVEILHIRHSERRQWKGERR